MTTEVYGKFGKLEAVTFSVPKDKKVIIDCTDDRRDRYTVGPLFADAEINLATLNGAVTFVTLTVDGKVVDSWASADTADKKTVDAENGWYIVDGMYEVKATDGKLALNMKDKNRVAVSAGKIDVTGAAGVSFTAAKGAITTTHLVAKGETITLTFKNAGSYKINDKVVTVKAGAIEEVPVNGDITVVDWETVDDFNANVAAVIEDLKEAKPSDGTIEINGKNVTLTINKTAVSYDNNLGTIFVNAIEDLLADGYTVKLHRPDGMTKNLASGEVWETLEDVLDSVLTAHGDEAEFTITIANAYDASDEYAVKVVNDVKD